MVYDPIKDEMFWAEKGIGAYLNDRRIRVSSRRNLEDALLVTGITPRQRGEDADRAAFVAQFDAALAATAGVRRLGSAALDLAYVAAGRYEGFWENHLSPWDIAAGIVLVREAGRLRDRDRRRRRHAGDRQHLCRQRPSARRRRQAAARGHGGDNTRP